MTATDSENKTRARSSFRMALLFFRDFATTIITTVIVTPRASPKAMCNHDPDGSIVDLSPCLFCEAPNGLRYRRLGRKRLRNGKLPKLRTNPKKRAESQPSGARFVRRSFLETHLGISWRNSMDCLPQLEYPW